MYMCTLYDKQLGTWISHYLVGCTLPKNNCLYISGIIPLWIFIVAHSLINIHGYLFSVPPFIVTGYRPKPDLLTRFSFISMSKRVFPCPLSSPVATVKLVQTSLLDFCLWSKTWFCLAPQHGVTWTKLVFLRQLGYQRFHHTAVLRHMCLYEWSGNYSCLVKMWNNIYSYSLFDQKHTKLVHTFQSLRPPT